MAFNFPFPPQDQGAGRVGVPPYVINSAVSKSGFLMHCGPFVCAPCMTDSEVSKTAPECVILYISFPKAWYRTKNLG